MYKISREKKHQLLKAMWENYFLDITYIIEKLRKVKSIEVFRGKLEDATQETT